MTEDQFWNLVQEAHDAAEGDMDTKCAAIESLVGALSPAGAAPVVRRPSGSIVMPGAVWPGRGR